MKRIALLPSEPIRERMAGIGIRYLEMARHLAAAGFGVRLINPGPKEEVPGELGDRPEVEVVEFARGELNSLLQGCQAAVSQGQLANDLVLEAPQVPTVIDLYDPFLVENLHYAPSLGLDPYRNDHATWVLQLSRGDFFLCSSEEQRQFYLGFLCALGRVNPPLVLSDPDLQTLIATVPFGVAEAPKYQPLLEAREPGERRLLFGGLYDWYDPWPVLEAFASSAQPNWTLLFIRNPNPDSTPQGLFTEVRRWCEARGLWGERVQALDWVPSGRRFDLLHEVDVLVAAHRLSLETRLSLRTRFLEALGVGCPVITSEGGAMSRMLRERSAGWVVPEGDSGAMAEALQEALGDDSEVERRVAAGRELASHFTWEKSLEPLVRFCQRAAQDGHKESFAFRPTTHTPKDSAAFRLRRWSRRLWRQARAAGGSGG